MEKVRQIGQQIKILDEQLKDRGEDRDYIAKYPQPASFFSTGGEDESSNIEIRRWGEPRQFEFGS